MDRVQKLSCLIGNTPLLAIDYMFREKRRTVYAKAENLNMTGSIKDRMAFKIIENGYNSGSIVPGALIVEATSGNTGISFAAIGRALGHPVTIFMPDWMSQERKNIIKALGSEIKLIGRDAGGFLGCIESAEELAKSTEGAFLPRQFSNEDNIAAHYETTGPEIWWQMRYRSLCPDAFIAGVGTGGTIMGIGKFLREKNASIKLHPLEPANSPTLSTGHKIGKHRIQGISDEFIPPILDLDTLDEVIGVDDGDSIVMAQMLASRLGLGVGISSGANFIGAVQVQNDLGDDSVVVTVFPDDNKKYLSTDLLNEEELKAGFLSSQIDLLGVRAFKRVCHTCCDPDQCIEAATMDTVQEDPMPHCPRRL